MANPGTDSGIQESPDVGSEYMCLEHIDSDVLIWLWKCITDVWSIVRIHMLPWCGLAHGISTIVHEHTLC